ncbi:MAG: MBL fold metallo-hydrolase [Thermoflexales bacterium]|nr:MBL fold metallo-hydrolase [Thermoflexales bacterium]
MHTERLSDDVYVFTSELYYQVTASLIVSGTIGILIDTLPFPEETVQIAQLVNRLCPDGVRYIIYTQHQADHVYGAAFFPRAEIIAHAHCRERMISHGYAALERARAQTPSLSLVKLRLPTLTFEGGSFALRLPGKTLELIRLPGHTPDSIVVLLQEEKLLFAGDTVMALPTVSDGEADLPALRQALEAVSGMQLDCIVQGHGEIILRGEIRDAIRRGQHYLETLAARIDKMVEVDAPRSEAAKLPIEQCGMTRVVLNGNAGELHMANAVAYYDRQLARRGPIKPPAVEAAPPKASPKPTPKAEATPAPKTATKPAPRAAAKKAVKPVKASKAPAKASTPKKPAKASPAKKTVKTSKGK